ncbi:MAG: hypothetical protein ACXWB2_02565 [Acidimicrobiales bacterium]
MICAPLVPDLSHPAAGPVGSARGISPRSIALVGIALIACGVIGLAAWGIFLSPLGFTRYPLSDRDRTFTLRRPGTYVVYFEFPGESRTLLPPALDIGVASLSGQKVDVTTISAPGHMGAPGAYDLWGHEGRAVALITSHEAGTFVVSITPTPASEVDTNSQRIVTQGTIALGREWSATWLASWGGVTLLVVVPVVAGASVLVLAWRRRAPRPVDGDDGSRPDDGEAPPWDDPRWGGAFADQPTGHPARAPEPFDNPVSTAWPRQ